MGTHAGLLRQFANLVVGKLVVYTPISLRRCLVGRSSESLVLAFANPSDEGVHQFVFFEFIELWEWCCVYYRGDEVYCVRLGLASLCSLGIMRPTCFSICCSARVLRPSAGSPGAVVSAQSARGRCCRRDFDRAPCGLRGWRLCRVI